MVMIIYGYVNLRTYYGAFGIKVHDYFSLEDYIQSNIDNLYRIVIPFFATYLAYLFIRANPIEKIDVAFSKNIMRSFSEGSKEVYSLLVLLVILVGVQFITHKVMFGYHFFSLAFTLAFPWIIIFLVSKNIIRSISEAELVSIIFAVTVLFYLYTSAIVDAGIVKEAGHNKRVEISLKKDYTEATGINEKTLSIIGLNSRYAFFYDKGRNRVYVIPYGALKSITHLDVDRNATRKSNSTDNSLKE